MKFVVNTERFVAGKAKTENHLLNAECVTDAEVKMTQLFKEQEVTEFRIKSVRSVRYNQIIYADPAIDIWFEITIKSTEYSDTYLVEANDLEEALIYMKKKLVSGEHMTKIARKDFATVTA